jgi:ABC-2 type transport system ATP-binding protein
VRGIDLTVNTGECFGLLGPNGAGKTTTMEMLEGLLDPTSGTLEVLGKTWMDAGDHLRERVGISLQETRLSDKLTVRETLNLFRSFYKQGITVEEAIGIVSLEEKARSYIDKLSGGQKQRLALACGLVGDPELLFLDEPTTGLDPQSRRQVWDIVQQLKSRGRTVLITTHYMDEAERLCDRVSIVDHGKIIALGTPAELIQQAGGSNIIDVTLAQDPHFPESYWHDLPSVRKVAIEGKTIHLTIDETHVTMPRILDMLVKEGCELTGLANRKTTLEDVFVQLTGRHLRDAD